MRKKKKKRYKRDRIWDSGEAKIRNYSFRLRHIHSNLEIP